MILETKAPAQWLLLFTTDFGLLSIPPQFNCIPPVSVPKCEPAPQDS